MENYLIVNMVIRNAIPKGSRKPRTVVERIGQHPGHDELTDTQKEHWSVTAKKHLIALKLRSEHSEFEIYTNEASFDGVFESVKISFNGSLTQRWKVIL